jgi:hypothetical protein
MVYTFPLLPCICLLRTCRPTGKYVSWIIAWCQGKDNQLTRDRSRSNCLHLSLYGSTVLLLDLDGFFSYLLLYTVGRTPLTGDQAVAKPLPTQRTIQTQNKRTQISMPWVEFEPTIPALKRVKTFHALDRAATVIGKLPSYPIRNQRIVKIIDVTNIWTLTLISERLEDMSVDNALRHVEFTSFIICAENYQR